MLLRVLSVALICAGTFAASAAERPNVPLARPNVATSGAGVATDRSVFARPLPAFRTAPADMTRPAVVRPDGSVASRPVLPREIRPIELPKDGIPAMPILPGRPEIMPIAPGELRPIVPGNVRPLPMSIEGRPIIVRPFEGNPAVDLPSIQLPARPAN